MGFFKNWNTWKGVSKFLLGAIGVIGGIYVGNPQPILNVIGNNWISGLVGGLIIEGVDYLHNRFFKTPGE